ncbi:class I SAM-dependent DNA methyltransferase [Micromonospora sagamiensis]
MDLDELAKELGREALRYLYRILFLLYAEARPELGVLPVNDPEYVEGYSLARIGDLVARRLAPSAEGGFHLYESLDLLFCMVNDGHRPRGGTTVSEQASEGEGLRFEPMKSDLFLPERTRLIGRLIPRPDADDDDAPTPTIDTRLRNKVLYQVLRRLMLTKGGRRRRGGFISYAQLGINQLGAVYEGLMSYTGFVATEKLYEVAKNGDPKDGSWMVPAAKHGEYDDSVFVYKENAYTGLRSQVSYDPGQFVYRLAGRDRQTSASYYTPQSLTEVTVQLALKYRLDQDDTVTPARELLDWTICEPALGSGAFLNEAINQVAAEYLRRRQKELGTTLDPEDYHLELQRVKAYIALHNCYGVDLNRTAVELAEVSLWLNVMHAGLQAPWFGLHLKRGNSLIGCGRKTYDPKQLADKSWLTTAPQEKPFRDGTIDAGTIHHFLLPADGWGAVAGEKEARELAPTETAKLKAWRTAMKRTPSAKGKNSQVMRLQALAGRVEFLWGLVRQRLAISEQEIRRDIPVWGADDLPPVTQAVERDKILADLTAPGTPYWRLKTLMDVWCALWFWPLDKVGLLDGSDRAYPTAPVQVSHVKDVPADDEAATYEVVDMFGNVQPQQMKLPTKATGGTRQITVAERLRQQVPLTNLDDWLTFAEALVGRKDADEDTERFYGRKLTSLAEMSEYEQRLDGVIGVDAPWTLADRFPWLLTAEQIADQQGFFHWELTFAQAFGNGGFDLQVGNPPWVRPDWAEDMVLAEDDPWFRLVERPAAEEWRARKAVQLKMGGRFRQFFLADLTVNVGVVQIIGGAATYPLLAGTRPDLYRAFMCRVWGNIGAFGIAGLVHPDTHFAGSREGRLRAAAYKRLRFHAHFSNRLQLFDEVAGTRQFGVHLYGAVGPIEFTHVSWLFAPSSLSASLAHDGDGEPPGIKHNGRWDLRPHRARLVTVNRDRLERWRRLLGGQEALEQTRLLFPVTSLEDGAMLALSQASHRLRDLRPVASLGLDEGKAKKDGLIVWDTGHRVDWDSVILQGTHIGIATPLAKQPNIPCRSNRDWGSFDLRKTGSSVVPRANYRRSVGVFQFESAQDIWFDKPCSRFYRLAWREMIPFDTERSLHAALIPPGPTHVDAVNTMRLAEDLDTVLAAGFWASLPLDYLLRVWGKGHLRMTEARNFPTPQADHPLAAALAIRALRLNCLTDAYSKLWSAVFDPMWASSEKWSFDQRLARPLADVGPSWEWRSALRTEQERRAALVEIDAIVAVWLGISCDELISIYRSRFPILADYEAETWFDGAGRKVAANHNAFGVGQTKEDYVRLLEYIEHPERNALPSGYVAPLYKADRESEYRQAHAVFSRRL